MTNNKRQVRAVASRNKCHAGQMQKRKLSFFFIFLNTGLVKPHLFTATFMCGKVCWQV